MKLYDLEVADVVNNIAIFYEDTITIESIDVLDYKEDYPIVSLNKGEEICYMDYKVLIETQSNIRSRNVH